jgi:hypothetical protein
MRGKIIRGTALTVAVSFIAAGLAYAAAFFFDRFISRVSLDTGFSIVFLSFVGAGAITAVILVFRGGKHAPR